MVVELLEPRRALDSARAFLGIGEHMQAEVMIADDETVADQVIQRVCELVGLRDSQIACRRHAVVLPTHHVHRGAFGQEREALREDERKVGREEAAEHAGRCRRRVLLDAEEGTDAALRP